MLAITRKSGESIVIDKRILITILETRGNRSRVGISAPADVSITRGEFFDLKLLERINENRKKSGDKIKPKFENINRKQNSVLRRVVKNEKNN